MPIDTCQSLDDVAQHPLAGRMLGLLRKADPRYPSTPEEALQPEHFDQVAVGLRCRVLPRMPEGPEVAVRLDAVRTMVLEKMAADHDISVLRAEALTRAVGLNNAPGMLRWAQSHVNDPYDHFPSDLARDTCLAVSQRKTDAIVSLVERASREFRHWWATHDLVSPETIDAETWRRVRPQMEELLSEMAVRNYQLELQEQLGAGEAVS